MIGRSDDPVLKIFKHVFYLSLLMTFLLVVIALILDWSVVQILGSFWLGVTVNLISFKMIVKQADKLIGTESESTPTHGMSMPKSSGFFTRFILYAICAFLVIQFGELIAVIGFAIGISMVGLILKLGATFQRKN